MTLRAAHGKLPGNPRSASLHSLRGELKHRKKERRNVYALMFPMFPTFQLSDAPRAREGI